MPDPDNHAPILPYISKYGREQDTGHRSHLLPTHVPGRFHQHSLHVPYNYRYHVKVRNPVFPHVYQETP